METRNIIIKHASLNAYKRKFMALVDACPFSFLMIVSNLYIYIYISFRQMNNYKNIIDLLHYLKINC